MKRKAYAKLTFYLHATKDSDGSLRFRNVIVPIDLFDMVYLDKHPRMHIETNKAYLPNDKRNTVYRVLKLMKQRYNIKDNFKVRIVKNIPAQSGLGGGSADAAALIHMLNEMYELNLSDTELIAIAREIDEDTPYCLFNRPMLVEGIGDVLTPLPLNTELYYVLVKPGFGVSTQSFLKKFNHFQEQEPQIEACMNAMQAGDFDLLTQTIHNDFEISVRERYEKMEPTSTYLKALGLEGVSMTGSGTGIFGLCQSREEAIQIYEKIVFKYPFVKYGKILTGI